MKWLTDLLGGGASKIIDSVTDGVDKFITTDEEKQELELLKQKAKLEFKRLEMDMETKIIEDRQSAREMYSKDSSLQKVFALIFLGGYLALSIAMVVMIFGMFGVGEILKNLEPFQASLISMVFTAMSVKVNTITDFLFGGSKGQDDSEERMAAAFRDQSAHTDT